MGGGDFRAFAVHSTVPSTIRTYLDDGAGIRQLYIAAGFHDFHFL